MNTPALLICSTVGLALVGVALWLFASYILHGWLSDKERGLPLLLNAILVAVLGAVFLSVLVLALVRLTQW
jgi:hypothetical protein